MTKDEFIIKWSRYVDEYIEKEFISDFEDVMAWYKHELWDRWNEL